MMQQTGSTKTPATNRYWRSLLTHGLSWLAVLGSLSGGMLAQASPNEVETPPASIASEPESFSPSFVVEAVPQAPIPIPVAPAIEPIPAQTPLIYSEAPGRVPTSRDASALTNPQLSVPPVNSGDAYIDSTSYSVGATQPYEGPESVVISERSSGCQAVLRSGEDLGSGACGGAIAQKPTYAWNSPAKSWESNRAARGISSIQVGPISLGTDGIRVGSSTASGDYYNRTVRPPGRLGNGNISLIFPLSIPAPITSLFGWRIHPIFGDSRFHSGTDLGAPLGTPVLAAYAGQVAIADFLGGYGLTVVLNHNQNTQETLYAHLSEIFVQPGEEVKQGSVIGRVGSTGNSTGPHLHFEFRQLTKEGWVALDPGTQLEYAMAQLIKALQVAQSPTPSQG
ncbi:MAG: M23 family metallopeptidase [Leptolyngbyaceae bacterium]|nr:M23 family metallopeptidase [Leptolyngbyaceae bacterium]